MDGFVVRPVFSTELVIRMSVRVRRSWRRFLMLVILVAATAGCGLLGPVEAVEPRPSRPAANDTISRSRLGAELVVTAIVAKPITTETFVVKDADLPKVGLMVLAGDGVDLDVHDLVTVRGRVQLFDLGRVTLRSRPADTAVYTGFDRMLVADEVRNWS
ncbi:hypothetical protein [Paractinoplanes rishiriensis]|uniref:hypothetical protein n=1 Tax=Paractinoplanes rishiriensis TaxID=1050105 RepID=UPI001941AD73|nr:hypothetical protein [Actinoplanes rishiriensis]